MIINKKFHSVNLFSRQLPEMKNPYRRRKTSPNKLSSDCPIDQSKTPNTQSTGWGGGGGERGRDKGSISVTRITLTFRERPMDQYISRKHFTRSIDWLQELIISSLYLEPIKHLLCCNKVHFLKNLKLSCPLNCEGNIILVDSSNMWKQKFRIRIVELWKP